MTGDKIPCDQLTIEATLFGDLRQPLNADRRLQRLFGNRTKHRKDYLAHKPLVAIKILYIKLLAL